MIRAIIIYIVHKKRKTDTHALNSMVNTIGKHET
jgi:hypothetical protein